MDRPILFSGPMVRALLDGSKTQTRRVLKPQPKGFDWFDLKCRPRYARGDRLWVREPLRANSNDQGARWYGYAVDGKDVWPLTEWTKARENIVSIHMPRWASRITLIVTDVRVQRLQEIDADDAFEEGTGYRRDGIWHHAGGHPSYSVSAFQDLWDGINGNRPGCAWSDNPWVCAVSFEVHRQNIDQMERP